MSDDDAFSRHVTLSCPHQNKTDHANEVDLDIAYDTPTKLYTYLPTWWLVPFLERETSYGKY